MKKDKGFIYNTFVLVLGNGGAQAINILTIPIITRLFTPDSFGQLTFLISITTVLIEVACLRYQIAILLPKDEEEPIHIFILSSLICGLFALCTGVVVFLICKFQLFGLDASYERLLWFLPLIVFFGGIYKPLNVLSLRQKRFLGLSISRVSESIVNKGISISWGGLTKAGGFELICSFLIGKIASVMFLSHLALKNGILTSVHNISLETLRRTARRYRDYAVYSFTAVIEAFSNELLLLFSGLLMGSSVVGFIGLTKRVIQQPLNIIGDAVSRSFFQKVSELHRDGNDYSFFCFELFRSLLSFSLIPTVLFACIAPDVFEIVFGPQWREAGYYYSILCASFLSSFLYRPISIIFDVQEKQKLRFWLNTSRVGLNAFVFYFSFYYAKNITATLFCFSLVNTVFFSGIILILLSFAHVKIKQILFFLSKQLSVCVLFVITILFTKACEGVSVYSTFMLASVLTFVYLLTLILCEPKYKYFLIPFLRKTS